MLPVDSEERPRPGGEGCVITYCLIPADLASKLHDPLREHFRDDPAVEVVVERRRAERRDGAERRVEATEPPDGVEQRRIRSKGGRRVAEQRVGMEPREAPPLPRRAARHAQRISFLERVEPAEAVLEDRDSARLVLAFQAGADDAFTALYTRYFNRVYAYLLVVLGQSDEAEEAAQQVFTSAFAGLGEFEYRGQPFRAWLFTVARNYAVDQLRRRGRVEVTDPDQLDRHREQNGEGQALPEDSAILSWISDRNLSLFVERLPVAQRQVLILSFGVELPDREIAAVLGRTPEDVRKLRSRALAFLRARLDAAGRRSERRGRRIRMRRWPREAPVLRARRWALHL